MDPRSAGHALSQIADFLELKGENRFKSAAYRNAARAVLAIQTDDLASALGSGELAELKGIGPATLSTIRELIESGESRYLEQLRSEIPEGLLEMLRVPGLGTAKIQKIHEALGVSIAGGARGSRTRWTSREAAALRRGHVGEDPQGNRLSAREQRVHALSARARRVGARARGGARASGDRERDARGLACAAATRSCATLMSWPRAASRPSAWQRSSRASKACARR